MTYSAEVLADSPLAYYRLGDASGATATDSSGNSRNGSYVNSPTLGAAGLVTADADTAVTLTAASSQEVTSSSNAALSASNMMIEVIAKSSTVGQWCRDHTSAGGTGWFLDLAGTNMAVRISGTTYTSSYASSNVRDGNPHHIVWGADATTVYLYVDGTLRYSTSRGATGGPTLPWHLGRNGTSTPYISGTVDEWAIYSSLSGARVAAHYAAYLGTVTVDLPAATATGAASAPTVELDVNLPAATATGDAPAPTVAQVTGINIPAAAASAAAATPEVVLYTDLTIWDDDLTQSSRIEFGEGAVLDFEPPVEPAPGGVDDGLITRLSLIYDAPDTVIDGIPINWGPTSRIREDVGYWQVVIDGRDRTFFRGKRTQIGSFTGTEPGGDELCTLRFPLVTPFDHPGNDDVAWLHDGAHVEIRIRLVGGGYLRLWTGKYVSEESSYDGTNWGYIATCTGALDDADRAVLPASVRNDARDIGRIIADTFNGVLGRGYTTMAPIVTGIPSRKRGPHPSRLQFITELLATATASNGIDQWTLDNLGWKPVLKLKDNTTIHATVRAGQEGVRVQLTRDTTSSPRRIYGEGTRPDGMRFRNMKFPGARVDSAPLFPLDPGDYFGPGSSTTGFAPFAQEMRDHGYTMHSGDTYDSRDEAEVRDAQSRGGILIDSLVGPQTWATIFAVGSNTGDLYSAYQAPLAEHPGIDPHAYNVRGEVIGPNPHYVPGLMNVERYEDFGEGTTLDSVRRSARGELARTYISMWSGTVTLTVDPQEMSRFRLRAGMNLLLQGHHTLDRRLHIAKHEIDPKTGTVTLTVDMLDRDIITLNEIRKRNRETATSPVRRVTNSRSSQIIDTYTIWDGESPAGIIPRHAAIAGLWIVLRIPAGQAGTIAKFHMTSSGPASEFAVGVFGRPITANQLARLVGSPFDTARPWDANEDALKDLGIQAAWGGQDNPCGYGAKAKTDDGATLTGKFVDDGGFSYATDYPGWLWVAEYVRTSCYLEGRMTPGVEGL